MLKKILLFLISNMLIFNNTLTVFAESDSIYYDASEKLRRANVIITRDIDEPFEGMYDKAQVTRAEFSGVILNALREEISSMAEKTYFQDCDTKDWYTPYINKLFELKIVSGYGNDNFKPKNIVTNFEAITMLVRCLGYDNVKTENETYPYRYLEIAENLDLFANTTINKAADEPLTNGNLFILLLNSMRSNINGSTQKLWDFGLKTALYEKVTGKVTSVNDSECVVENDTESINLIWNYEEDISAYLTQEVSVWFVTGEDENYVLDMVFSDAFEE